MGDGRCVFPIGEAVPNISESFVCGVLTLGWHPHSKGDWLHTPDPE